MPNKLFALEGNGARPSHQGDGYSESEVSYTLNHVEQHGVCYDPNDRVSATLCAAYGTNWNGNSGAYSGDNFVFSQNQREEVRDLGDIAGSLAANPGTHHQTFVGTPCYGADIRNGTLNEEVNGTLQAKANGGWNANSNAVICYGIGSYGSNAWKSPNPHSGVYVAETSRTLDALQCGYPACNQGGGVAIVEEK